MIVDRVLLAAYTFLTERHVILRQVGKGGWGKWVGGEAAAATTFLHPYPPPAPHQHKQEGENDAAAMHRVTRMPMRELMARREALAALRHKLNSRAGGTFAGYMRGAAKAAAEAGVLEAGV